MWSCQSHQEPSRYLSDQQHLRQWIPLTSLKHCLHWASKKPHFPSFPPTFTGCFFLISCVVVFSLPTSKCWRDFSFLLLCLISILSMLIPLVIVSSHMTLKAIYILMTLNPDLPPGLQVFESNCQSTSPIACVQPFHIQYSSKSA